MAFKGNGILEKRGRERFGVPHQEAGCVQAGLPSFICLWGVTSAEQSSERCDDLDGSRSGLSRHRLPGDKNWGCLSGPWRWLGPGRGEMG